VPHSVQHVPGSFITHPQLVSSAHRFDYSLLLRNLYKQIETFNKNGSNFNFDYITQFVIVITQYRSLARLLYIPTPPHIKKKKTVINVVNKDDECFRWSIFAGLYSLIYNATRVCFCTRYRDTLNFDGIFFPVQTSDIAKFEKPNHTISVNVISPEDNNKGFCVEYLSPHRQRQHHVNLLLYGDPEGITHHYMYIKTLVVCSAIEQSTSTKALSATVVLTCFRHSESSTNISLNFFNTNHSKLRILTPTIQTNAN